MGPVTETIVASNAASGAEAKQARSVFSLLGLGPFLLSLTIGVTLMVLGSQPVEADDLSTKVAALRLALEKNPDDVDLRLKLAFHLSWQGEGDRARKLAEQVIALAPEYWDAHILRARMTAWGGAFTEAREQLAPALAANPENREALKLLALIAIWAHDWSTAERTLNALIAKEPSAELYFQLAQVAVAKLDPLEARHKAGKALSLDPDHPRARALRQHVKLVKLSSTTQLEVFSALRGENRHAYSQVLLASLLPGAALGAVLRYDFSRRFGTDNHRLGARLNLRADEDLLFSVFLRGGKTKVLPRWSADVGVTRRMNPTVSLGARYNLDSMSWPGTLHRGTGILTVAPGRHLLLGAQYFAGVMRHCGESNVVQGVRVRSRLTRGRVAAELRYAFGTELERPALAPFLEGRVGSDFCVDETESDGSPLDLAETRAHEVGGTASVEVRSLSLLLLGGYAMQLRLDDTRVHITHLSLQRSF